MSQCPRGWAGGGAGGVEQASRKGRKNGNLASIPPCGAPRERVGRVSGGQESMSPTFPLGIPFKGAAGLEGKVLRLLHEEGSENTKRRSFRLPRGQCLDLLRNVAGGVGGVGR